MIAPGEFVEVFVKTRLCPLQKNGTSKAFMPRRVLVSSKTSQGSTAYIGEAPETPETASTQP